MNFIFCMAASSRVQRLNWAIDEHAVVIFLINHIARRVRRSLGWESYLTMIHSQIAALRHGRVSLDSVS